MAYDRPELYHDNFQNYKSYHIPKAQLVIADCSANRCRTDFCSYGERIEE